MAQHPYNSHREQQVAHRRVDVILSGSPAGAKKHADGPAFSKITSKSAAVRDDDVRGHSGAKRFARGGKVRGKGNTNIAIVLPGAGKGAAEPGPLPGGPPMGAAPMPPPPMGGAPGGPPPGMPMRARGGGIAGESTDADQKSWGKRAAKNSYARGGMTAGAESGVGRLQKAGK